MPLYLTDDQIMLKDMVGPMLGEEGPRHLRRLRDGHDAAGWSRELWARFGEMGLAGVLVPETAGGSGLGHVEAGIVLEAIGRNLTPSPFLATAVAGVTVLAAADDAVRGRWLPDVVTGSATIGIAVDEGAKHRPAAIALRAERSGNGFRLTGSKTFVVQGGTADLLIVAARTAGAAGEEAGITLFAVPRASEGLDVESVRLADSGMAARLAFDGVAVDADAVIGEVDGGWGLLSRMLDAGRAGAAAELVGVGGAALDLTVDYLKTRRQFGREIGTFQALQFRAAHLYSELEIARAATLKAQQMLDAEHADAPKWVAVAKAKAGQAATLAVQEGVQMHGGIGMTDEYDIGLYMKRDRVLQEWFGDAAFQADRLAVMNGF
ncbi:acyl-CoA dehydrogenase family protein [Sphingomonas montana]|uniref:acyl-CoA dehydrogenase family protein n=1 Tax=Sphingomonas montana TaxID=1843236 RepID=UPI00096DD43C|nr:acyl-CoA dehydrogenase family protein [Sphingomonas montana]